MNKCMRDGFISDFDLLLCKEVRRLNLNKLTWRKSCSLSLAAHVTFWCREDKMVDYELAKALIAVQIFTSSIIHLDTICQFLN